MVCSHCSRVSFHQVSVFPAGFMQQFAAIVDPARPEQNIGKVLERLSGGRKPTRIVCTGHSLGGALATLGDLSLSLSLCLPLPFPPPPPPAPPSPPFFRPPRGHHSFSPFSPAAVRRGVRVCQYLKATCQFMFAILLICCGKIRQTVFVAHIQEALRQTSTGLSWLPESRQKHDGSASSPRQTF